MFEEVEVMAEVVCGPWRCKVVPSRGGQSMKMIGKAHLSFKLEGRGRWRLRRGVPLRRGSNKQLRRNPVGGRSEAIRHGRPMPPMGEGRSGRLQLAGPERKKRFFNLEIGF
jgi:hypothetical protein